MFVVKLAVSSLIILTMLLPLGIMVVLGVLSIVLKILVAALSWSLELVWSDARLSMLKQTPSSSAEAFRKLRQRIVQQVRVSTARNS